MNKTTRTLALIVAICIALAVYFVLLGQRGIQLIQDGGGAVGVRERGPDRVAGRHDVAAGAAAVDGSDQERCP